MAIDFTSLFAEERSSWSFEVFAHRSQSNATFVPRPLCSILFLLFFIYLFSEHQI